MGMTSDQGPDKADDVVQRGRQWGTGRKVLL